MPTRGLHTSVKYLLSFPALVTLLGIALTIFMFRKKMTLLDRAKEIFSLAIINGFSDLHATFVVSQAAHETNGFTSSVFKRANNLFGMNYYVGQSFSVGKFGVYAVYANVEDSVLGFKDWTDRHVPILGFLSPRNTLSQWVRYLKVNNYFTDTEENYLKGCEYWHKKIWG